MSVVQTWLVLAAVTAFALGWAAFVNRVIDFVVNTMMQRGEEMEPWE